MVEHLPLLADVGNALARYLRGGSEGERLSTRVLAHLGAPRRSDWTGSGGPRRPSPARARENPDTPAAAPPTSSATAFSSHMIRHGASLAEIAEVLRHRSQTTTAIYTHVSFEALRAVARPWPPDGR